MHRIGILLVALCVQALSLRAQTPAGSSASVFMLRNGDALRVRIPRDSALSGDFPVDEDGVVTLPLVGRWHAAAVRFPVLRDSLLAAYQREIRNEAISIVPLRRVYVLGSVLKPGVYMLDPTLGLEGAISMAGGAGPDGNLDNIRVQRDGKRLTRKITLNAPPSEYDVHSGDQLFVERRSFIDRNSALLLTSMISLAGIAITLIRR